MGLMVESEAIANTHGINSHFFRQHMQLCGVSIDVDDRVDQELAAKAMKSYDDDLYRKYDRKDGRVEKNPKQISHRVVSDPRNNNQEVWDEIVADHRRQHKL